MTPSKSRQLHLSRDQVLVAHAAEMIARTSMSQDKFAQVLAASASKSGTCDSAALPGTSTCSCAASNDATTFLKASGSWLKRVQRWIGGDIELPSWVEEAWVLALDAEYQERCLNELASRHGLIGARALDAASCPVSAFGQLVTRLGAAVEATSEVLSDGKIDASDLPLLPEAIDKLLAVESRAHELRRRMENELAIHVGGKPLRAVG